jgi:allantoin racemase
MRIKVIVPFPLNSDAVALRRQQLPDLAINRGTEVTYVPVAASGDWGDSYHDDLLMDFFVYTEGMRSEEEGYDAVCIDTASDAGLARLRSRLTIPVLGPGQTSCLVACLLGRRFSILTLWDGWIRAHKKIVRENGLESRCASIRSVNIEPDLSNLLEGKDSAFYEDLSRLAVRCVEVDGSDVIVLGSTTMFAAHSYLAERLPVPVINPGLVTFKVAESLVTLGLSHSKVAFATPRVSKDAIFLSAARAVRKQRA